MNSDAYDSTIVLWRIDKDVAEVFVKGEQNSILFFGDFNKISIRDAR